MELPEPYHTFVAEVVNGMDGGLPTGGGLLLLGEKPVGWLTWEADFRAVGTRLRVLRDGLARRHWPVAI